MSYGEGGEVLLGKGAIRIDGPAAAAGAGVRRPPLYLAVAAFLLLALVCATGASRAGLAKR